MDRMGAPEICWLLANEYIADVHNICADESLGYRIPREIRHGGVQDISAFLEYRFYEKIFYLDSDESFPSSKEKPGWWVGVAHNVGDALTFKILTEDSQQVVHRSVIRPATDDRFRNKHVHFAPEPETEPHTKTSIDPSAEHIDRGGLTYGRRRLKIDRGLSRRRKPKQVRHQQRWPNTTSLPTESFSTLHTDVIPENRGDFTFIAMDNDIDYTAEAKETDSNLGYTDKEAEVTEDIDDGKNEEERNKDNDDYEHDDTQPDPPVRRSNRQRVGRDRMNLTSKTTYGTY